MRTTVTATLLGLLIATPAVAQAPNNIQGLLGGLLTGNQGQDQALREAYQRGYQRGRDDQARQDRRDGRGNGRGDYRDQGGPNQGYAPPGNPAYNRNPSYDNNYNR